MNTIARATALILFFLSLTSCGGGGGDGGDGQTNPSDPDKGSVAGSPITPSNLNAVGENSRIVLKWNAVADATSYTLAWSDTAGQTQTGTTVEVSNAVEYTHEFLADGKQRLTTGVVYYYSIRASNKNGTSKSSSEIVGQLKKKPWLMPLLNSVMGN